MDWFKFRFLVENTSFNTGMFIWAVVKMTFWCAYADAYSMLLLIAVCLAQVGVVLGAVSQENLLENMIVFA